MVSTTAAAPSPSPPPPGDQHDEDDVGQPGAAGTVEWLSPFTVTPRFAEMKRALGRLAEVRTIAFTSGHAVDALVGALRAMGHDVRALFGVRLAAVGPATARRLERYGLSADLVPSAAAGGEALARELIAAGPAALPDPILLPRAADGRPELATLLVAAGRRVEVVAAYDVTPDAPALKRALMRHAAEPYAAIGFCSPRGVGALLDAFGGPTRLAGVQLGAIGETTRAALVERGLAVAVVPELPSAGALAAALTALCS